MVAHSITESTTMDLKKSLRTAIFNKGIKHKDLADQLGTTTQQISNWLKSGKMKQDSMVSVSKALDLSVSEFVALGE